MPEGVRLEGLLSAEDRATLEAVGSVEVLVGVPTLNHRHSVGRVLEAVATGVATAFQARKAAVLVADAGSRDETLDAVRAWRETAPATVVAPCVRLAGPARRGRAVLAILAAARHLGARASAFVDADLIGVEPGWIERLLGPVLLGQAEYVAPAYTRAVTEGTLTSNLLAPMTRALYGTPIQQLVGGCAGVGAELVSRCLEDDVAGADVSGYGVEIYLAVAALVSGRPVIEIHLGRKRTDPGPVPPDLATMVAGVVGPYFELMDRYRAVWPETPARATLRRLGEAARLLGAEGEAHPERMVRAFRLGLKDLSPIWGEVMAEETLGRLYALGLLAADEFRFPPGTWARVVSDFAVAYHQRRLVRPHLLRALTPLYLGRVAAFLLEAQRVPASGLPALLEAVDAAFAAEREYLAARWR